MEDTMLLKDTTLRRRYRNTLRFLKATLPPPARILDIGAPNPFSRIMQSEGYTVYSTEGDLDEAPEDIVRGFNVDAVTAFEILEHLVAPCNVLRALQAPRLFVTVPLRLWFATAYRNPHDPWDRHFHEFEDWQFDWLLKKSSWQIVRQEKWTNPKCGLGFRPILRSFTLRYYAVEAVRAEGFRGGNDPG